METQNKKMTRNGSQRAIRFKEQAEMNNTIYEMEKYTRRNQ